MYILRAVLSICTSVPGMVTCPLLCLSGHALYFPSPSVDIITASQIHPSASLAYFPDILVCACRYAEPLNEAHDEAHLSKFEDLLEAAVDLDRIPDEYLICASYDPALEVRACLPSLATAKSVSFALKPVCTCSCLVMIKGLVQVWYRSGTCNCLVCDNGSGAGLVPVAVWYVIKGLVQIWCRSGTGSGRGLVPGAIWYMIKGRRWLLLSSEVAARINEDWRLYLKSPFQNQRRSAVMQELQSVKEKHERTINRAAQDIAGGSTVLQCDKILF
jgi:hypothetical protein